MYFRYAFFFFLAFGITLFSFSQEIKENPYNINDIYKYYETKNFEKVKEKLELWLSNSPSSFPPEAFLILGSIYDHLKLYDLAIKVFEKGMELSKNKFPFQANIAQAYRHKGDHKKAIELLSLLTDKATLYPEIYFFLGFSYFELRERIKTISYWELFLTLKPTGAKPDKVRSALAWLKQKDFKWPEELKEENSKQAEELKKLAEELKKQSTEEKIKEIDKDPKLKEEDLNIKDKGKQEGEKFDEIER